MKHYKAILCIHNRITDLQIEFERLDKIRDEESYGGHVFIENDKANINNEIEQLTETLKMLCQQP